MSLLTKIVHSFRKAAEHRGKVRACEQLMQMSDRQLADFGFSKFLLLQGASAWPWRTDEQSNGTTELSSVITAKQEQSVGNSMQGTREIRKAIKELSAYSDRELSEMGITRGSIKEVVLTGRPSIDDTPQDQKRAA